MVNGHRLPRGFTAWIKAVLALTAAGTALLWAMQFLSHDLRFGRINAAGYEWRTLTQPHGTLLRVAAAGVIVATGAWTWRRGSSRAATLLAAALAAGAATVLVYELWGFELNQAASMTRYGLLVIRAYPWRDLLAP